MATWSELHGLFSLIGVAAESARNLPARANIAPTQDVLTLAAVDGATQMFDARWWLVPHWARELQSKYPMFNARRESAAEKPSFRDPIANGQRCLIPADGYYEWTKNPADGGRDPHYIHLPDRAPFAFAGLWAQNDRVSVEGQPGVTSCTIFTDAAAPALKHLHTRMPVILRERDYEAWLDPATPPAAADRLMDNTRADELTSYRVDRRVNSSRATGDDLIEPVRDDRLL